ncbi:MAG: EAL domain-containing protein [Pseudomonadota bacterium]
MTSLSRDLRELFPFFILIDRDMRVLSYGHSALKVCPDLKVGDPFTQHLTLTHPRVSCDTSSFQRHSNKIFLCRSVDDRITLRGQMFPVGNTQATAYLCSPWFDDPALLSACGLTEADFAPHEASIEHLYLTHTRLQQMRELKTLNERLSKTIAESRRLAETEASLTRDLEVAADLRVHLAAGKVTSVTVNSNQLTPLVQDISVGQDLNHCPAWLKEAISAAAVSDITTRSSARNVALSKDSNRRSLDIRVSRASEDQIIVLGRDVTEARTEHVLLLETLEQAIEAVIMTDDTGTISFFNKAAEDLLQFSKAEVMGNHINRLFDSENGRASLAYILKKLRKNKNGHFRGEMTVDRRDGVELLCSYSMSRVRVGASVVTTAFIQDITDQRHAEVKIRHQANHDNLTGLPNRSRFFNAVSERLDNSTYQSFAVALIDLDNFKTINDLLGHGAGDEYLRITAKRIGRSIRESDLACRIGGDEFAVILDDVNDRLAGETAMRKVLTSLSMPMVLDDVHWDPSASIGVAFRDDTDSAADLLRHADLAMYESKAKGKGRVHSFTPELARRARQRIEMQKRLERALERDEIRAYFQPIVELETGKPVAFEALARWETADGEMISPDDFIPIAENSDLIVKIGEHIIQQSLATVKRIREQYIEFSDLRVNVNMSSRHFVDPALISTIRQGLADYGVEPDALTIELTESILLSDTRAVRKQFQDLKALGIAVSLDDFGTGYSSLSYLEQYQFDSIKIDKSFIRDLATEKVRRRLTKIIIAVGNAIGMKVVAEGIENFEDENILRRMGCQYGQGYLFSKPLEPVDIDGFLTQFSHTGSIKVVLPESKSLPH